MLSQRNGRHVSLAQAGATLQNPAYRPADVFENEGFGANTPDPSPIRRQPFVVLGLLFLSGVGLVWSSLG